VSGILRSIIGLSAVLRFPPHAETFHLARFRAAIGALASARGRWRMAAPRDVAAIDGDLKFVHMRREMSRRRISAISAEIVADTGMIDRLLAERSAAMAARQVPLLPTSS
jgi:hypothetical protein